MIGNVSRIGGLSQPNSGRQTIESAPGFGDALDALLRPATQAPAPSGVGGSIQFSKHAQARLVSRGIELDDSDMQDLGNAMDQLQRKGARESLVLLGDNAFIVGVNDRKVITAMTRQEAIGNIFTNIDSTVVAR